MLEKIAEELRADGSFITGDLGLIHEDGYVTIVGRNKDLIISGGYNIYSKEIELILDDQPGVLESAVIGVPHPDFGESVVGLIVAKPGATVTTENIMAVLGKKLARFKQPKKNIIVMSEFPRNIVGKLQQHILREQFENTFEAPKS